MAHKADMPIVINDVRGKADIVFVFEVDQNWWDNFKNTLWDSMERLSGVGQDKQLKLHFYLRPPLDTTTPQNH
jgi:hypothetical protein